MKKFWINLLLSLTKRIYISTNKIIELDKNKDEYISIVELLEPLKDHKVVCKIIKFVNKWLYAFINVPVDRILLLDEDQDDKITLNELWRYIKKQVKKEKNNQK